MGAEAVRRDGSGETEHSAILKPSAIEAVLAAALMPRWALTGVVVDEKG